MSEVHAGTRFISRTRLIIYVSQVIHVLANISPLDEQTLSAVSASWMLVWATHLLHKHRLAHENRL